MTAPDLPVLPPGAVAAAADYCGCGSCKPNARQDIDAFLRALTAEPESVRQGFARFLHPEAYAQECPGCGGTGTVVKNGPSEYEYDSAFPCRACNGTGKVPDTLRDAISRALPRPMAYRSHVLSSIEAAVLPFIAEAEERNTASWVAGALAEAEARGFEAGRKREAQRMQLLDEEEIAAIQEAEQRAETMQQERDYAMRDADLARDRADKNHHLLADLRARIEQMLFTPGDDAPSAEYVIAHNAALDAVLEAIGEPDARP